MYKINCYLKPFTWKYYLSVFSGNGQSSSWASLFFFHHLCLFTPSSSFSFSCLLYLQHVLSLHLCLPSFFHHPNSLFVSSCPRYANKEFWTRIVETISANKLSCLRLLQKCARVLLYRVLLHTQNDLLSVTTALVVLLSPSSTLFPALHLLADLLSLSTANPLCYMSISPSWPFSANFLHSGLPLSFSPTQ